MKSKTAIKFIFCLFACSLIFTANAFAEERDIYVITIGTNGRDFNDDSVAVAGGDKIDGGVMVYINGNPVSEYNGWGTFKQINQYIKKGENTLSLTGISNKSLFVKIGIMNGQDFKNVVAKKEFKSGDISKIPTLVFTTNIDYSLHLFNENNKIPENISGKSIYSLLQQLKKSFDEADYLKVGDLLLTQRKSWSIKAYGQDEKSFEKTKEQAIEFYKSNKLTYIPPKLDDIKIIKGESVVMVYSDVNKTEYSTFKTLGDFVANSTDKTPAPAMVFAYIDGKWCIWE